MFTFGDVLNHKINGGKRKKDVIEWLGKTKCDGCKKDCLDILYDAKSKFGPWGVWCEFCFPKYTYGKLGTGWGQKYMYENDKFIKVEG